MGGANHHFPGAPVAFMMAFACAKDTNSLKLPPRLLLLAAAWAVDREFIYIEMGNLVPPFPFPPSSVPSPPPESVSGGPGTQKGARERQNPLKHTVKLTFS